MFELTLIIIFINYKDLINFVTLNTRNARKILTDLKALKAEFPLPRIISINESTTINESKQFILSR